MSNHRSKYPPLPEENKSNKTEAAFREYLRDPIVQTALAMTNGALGESILKDCFMRGAHYATRRCVAEHHRAEASKRASREFTPDEMRVIRERRLGMERADCKTLATIFDTTPQHIAAICKRQGSADWNK